VSHIPSSRVEKKSCYILSRFFSLPCIALHHILLFAAVMSGSVSDLTINTPIVALIDQSTNRPLRL
jgi:hypothetical protein